MKTVLIKGGCLLNSYASFFEYKKQFLLCQFWRCSIKVKSPKNKQLSKKIVSAHLKVARFLRWEELSPLTKRNTQKEHLCQ